MQKTIDESFQPELMLSYLQQGRYDETLETLTYTIDPTSGEDVLPHRIRTQDEIDAHGSFKTLANALETVPSRVRHNVVMQYVDGAHTPTSFGDWRRFAIEGDTVGIKVTSVNGMIPVSGTSTYAVSSYSSGVVTLGADPGFSSDQYQGKWVRVASGAGAGNLSPLQTHATTSFTTVGDELAADNTSVIEIVEPAASVAITGGYKVQLSMGGNRGLNNGHVVFQDFEIAAASGSWTFIGAFFEFERFSGLDDLSLFGANGDFDNCVLAGGTWGVIATLGKVELAKFTGQPSLILAGFIGVGADHAGWIDVGNDVTFVGQGVAALSADNGGRIRAKSNFVSSGCTRICDIIHASHVELKASQLASYDAGGTADVNLDGADVSFATIDADANNVQLGVHNSTVFGT